MFYNIYTIKYSETGVYACLRRKNIEEKIAKEYYNKYANKTQLKYVAVRVENVDKFLAKIEEEYQKVHQIYLAKLEREQRRWDKSKEMYLKGYKVTDIINYVHS